MIVDIRKFIYDKLYNHEDDRMENTNYKALRNIWDFVSIYNLGIKAELTTVSEKVNFKKQIGGNAFSIKLKDNKTYIYHLDKLTSLNKNNTQHQLCFLNLNEDNKCLCFSFHTKETGIDVLKLQDLIIHDNVEYIECDDPIHKFKSGDILVQILIELVKTNEAFSHIKIIQAQDNSVKRCHSIGIQLKYMRTITDAIPYYAKFGFLPQKKSDNMVFEYNKNIHMETPKIINSKTFDDLFLEIKEDNEILYNFYKSTHRDSILNKKKNRIYSIYKKINRYG